jgi:hypothetical protein
MMASGIQKPKSSSMYLTQSIELNADNDFEFIVAFMNSLNTS